VRGRGIQSAANAIISYLNFNQSNNKAKGLDMYWEFGLVTFEYFLVVITQKYNLTACNFCPLGVPNGTGRQMISDYEFLFRSNPGNKLATTKKPPTK
jgi:hypothetical protein